MSGSGREALPDFREWSGESFKCPGVVGDPLKSPGVVGRPSRMTGIGRKVLTDVWEALPVVR